MDSRVAHAVGRRDRQGLVVDEDPVVAGLRVRQADAAGLAARSLEAHAAASLQLRVERSKSGAKCSAGRPVIRKDIGISSHIEAKMVWSAAGRPPLLAVLSRIAWAPG